MLDVATVIFDKTNILKIQLILACRTLSPSAEDYLAVAVLKPRAIGQRQEMYAMKYKQLGQHEHSQTITKLFLGSKPN